MKKDYFGFFNKIFFIIIISSAVFFIVFYHLNQPGPSLRQITFEIKPGSGASEITKQARQVGLIRSELLFYIALHLTEMTTKIKAGEFDVPPSLSVLELINFFRTGKVKSYNVTIAEGLSSVQVVDHLNNQKYLMGEIKIAPPEGSILPDTYNYTKNYGRDELIRHMQKSMQNYLDKEWVNRELNDHIKTKEDVLILASVIEKETGKASERAKIAGVFLNRLKRNMRLQSDPTIIYGLTFGKPLGRPIRHSEIKMYTEYNTYQIKGLPKGAICNPGKEAIYAVLHPEKTDALYFVADGKGGHNFASNLKDHNINVIRWKKLKK